MHELFGSHDLNIKALEEALDVQVSLADTGVVIRGDELDVELAGHVLRELGETHGIKMRQLTRPFYVALSGRKASTPLFDSMAILGSDLTRVRASLPAG